MTAIGIVAKGRKSWQPPEFAIVLAFSLVGLMVWLVLAVATWTDSTIDWF